MKNTAVSESKQQHEHGSSAELCIAVVPRGGIHKENHPARFALYWIAYVGSEPDGLHESLQEVLVDPLLYEMWVATGDDRDRWLQDWGQTGFAFFAERQFQPGV